MRGDFWTATWELRRFRRLIGLGMGGALISAACFGAGLTMLLPIFKLFFSPEAANGGNPLYKLVENTFVGESSEAWRQNLANWINARIPEGAFEAFLLVMCIVLVLTLIGSCGRYLHELLTITAVQREAMVWRSKLFERMIYAPLGSFRDTDGSGHVSRLVVDVNVLMRGQLAILGKAVSEILKGAAALGVALWLDWRLTLLALIAAPLIAISMRRFGKQIKRASKRSLKEQSAMLKSLNNVFGALPVIKSYNAEGYERRRYARMNRKLFREQMAMRQARALSSPVIETLGMIGVMATATIAAWFFFDSDAPSENFLVVLLSLAVAGSSLKPLTSIHTQIKESDAAATRILQSVNMPLEPVQHRVRRDQPKLARHTRDVVYENVSYAYPDAETDALRHINFTAPFGSTTAIVGTNGSGKTTLMSLLTRLRLPREGRVLIDGTDIAEVNLRSLREQVSVVSQQTVLFEGTIAENIAYARPTTPLDRIIEAAITANAHEFIDKLPLGYATPLGEAGEGLSGGQRQRLAIARAIITNPSLLILDEATSQIDADSEAKINQALHAVRQGRTTFVIAHRLSTVIDADQIFVLDAGKLIDQGTHRELLDRCPAYQTLTRSQLQPPAA